METLNEWREELNAAIVRLNELFNGTDGLEPMVGAIFNSPTINTPTIVGGTQDNPVVSTGTFNNPTINNATINSSTIDGATLTNAVITSATYTELGSGAFANIGAGIGDLAIQSDLEAASGAGVPVDPGAYLGQLYRNTDVPGWFIWNGATWDQIGIL